MVRLRDDGHGSEELRVAAPRTRSAHIFPRLQPAASMASGTAEVPVIPGATLTSRKMGSPSWVTIIRTGQVP
jgi:hypothetical protein